MSTESVPFLLLFRNPGAERHRHLSPDERQQLLMKWSGWYERLAAQGKAIEGQPLEVESRVVSGPEGKRVVDGPYAEAKEAIGGYVKILARDLEEATGIAQQHPGLPYGLVIEIRRMIDQCELGVAAHPAARASVLR